MAQDEVLTPQDVKELAPLYEDVVLALKQVYDPEIPVNIYDLGLIYELHIDKEHAVSIKMTFTAPNCPMADEVLAEVKRMVEDGRDCTEVLIQLAAVRGQLDSICSSLMVQYAEQFAEDYRRTGDPELLSDFKTELAKVVKK